MREVLEQALAFHQRGDLAKAQALYQQALTLQPNHSDALNLLGVIAYQTQNYPRAVELISQAIAISGDHADAHLNLGNALQELKQWDAALASYGRAIALKPDYAEAFYNCGNALHSLKRLDEALASYERAIALRPGYAEAYNNRGNVLRDLKQLDAAINSFERAIAIRPDHPFLHGIRLHTKMLICNWTDFDIQIKDLIERIQQGKKATPMLALLALTSGLLVQRQAAQIWVNDKYPASLALPAAAQYARHGKIRIGYYSADYHNHATAYLMAELFERHDKDKFELVAFSFGPDINDAMRKRLVAAFDQFVDVRNQSDKEVALLSRNMEIDIAVDLKGFTQDARTGIFAHRAAPIQVSYIGYPGTMGAAYIDYLIADKTVIPEASRQHYSEKIVYLPHTYQVNDRSRAIAPATPSREELGLPAHGFVFCCFNNTYKITPATFDVWMRLLRQVEGSVLWLLEDNPVAARNLRQEAQVRGVAAERLVFARRLPLADHLARHRAADLFIDTLPYNAHTTASDALWAGLPVLTCMGEAFASRMAASLLNAIDLPELITTTPQQYEALAVELATQPQRLQQIKHKLERNRLTAPLFDTPLFTRNIEAAYTRIYERYHSGLPPDHIHVM